MVKTGHNESGMELFRLHEHYMIVHLHHHIYTACLYTFIYTCNLHSEMHSPTLYSKPDPSDTGGVCVSIEAQIPWLSASI